jgi:hypothetical protein
MKRKNKTNQTPMMKGMFDDPDATLTAGDTGDSRPARGRKTKPARQKRAPKPAAPTPPMVEPEPVVTPAAEVPEPIVEITDKDDKPIEPVVTPAPEGKPLIEVLTEKATDNAVNREAWLARAVEVMTPLFEAQGYKVPPVRVSCGWPSSRGLSDKKRAIGECWDTEAAKDGVNQIFISPYLDQSTADATLLATLVHEVVHAVVGIKVKHGKAFRKCALAVGLDGKMTATFAGEALKATIAQWEAQLGKYPHAQLDSLKRPTKKQSTRMIKCECSCGYTVRTTRKWLDEVGAPLCPCNKQPMKFELPADLDPDGSDDDDGGDE